jgi:hypothetical protein
MQADRDFGQGTGSCIISIKAVTANVQKPTCVWFAVSKDEKNLLSKEILLEPQISRYLVNETFDFPMTMKKNMMSGIYLEQKVRIEECKDQDNLQGATASFVEFDISSYLNMKLTSTDPLTEEFDIKDARLVSPTAGNLLLDVSVSLCADPPTIALEIPQSRLKEDDLFLTIRGSPNPLSVARVSSRSINSYSSLSADNREDRDDSHEEIEIIDEEGLENMSKRELIDRIKQLKKQNAELRNAQKAHVVPPPAHNRHEVLENMIVVLKNDLATVLNAIQKDGNFHIFDEIKDKVSFFS